MLLRASRSAVVRNNAFFSFIFGRAALCRHLAFFLCAAGGLASRGRMGRQDCLSVTLPRVFEG